MHQQPKKVVVYTMYTENGREGNQRTDCITFFRKFYVNKGNYGNKIQNFRKRYEKASSFALLILLWCLYFISYSIPFLPFTKLNANTTAVFEILMTMTMLPCHKTDRTMQLLFTRNYSFYPKSRSGIIIFIYARTRAAFYSSATFSFQKPV